MNKTFDKQKKSCTRCGTCCSGSSPTLHKKDAGLILDGLIRKSAIYTIRIGELIWNPIKEKLELATNEILKIKEAPDGGCVYYDKDQKACLIYAYKPIQCARLKCWDHEDFIKTFNTPMTTRKELVKDKILLKLIDEHEDRCNYNNLDNSLKQIEKYGEEPVKKILDSIKFDYYFRPFIAEKMAIDSKEIDFYFGRSLIETIHMYDLQVTQDNQGFFLLSPLPSNQDI